MAKTTSQLHADLKALAKKTRENIYDMLRIANTILEDAEYCDQFGSEAQLIEIMEADEFAHFGGRPSLAQMLRAYRANPKRETWSKYKFNIAAMIELAKPVKEGEEVERINWKALAKQLQAKVEEWEATLADYRSQTTAQRVQIEQLTASNGELRGELRAVREMAAA